MIVTVDVQAASAILWLKNGEKGMAYAVANAINDTVKSIQTAQQQNVSQGFTLRDRKDFILRQAAIIKPFASPTKRSFEAKVKVGDKPGLFLPGYEKGFERKTKTFERKLAPGMVSVPAEARPSPSATIAAALRISSFKFPRASAARRVVKGEQRTYAIRDVGVFQRTGKGEKTRMLYALVSPFQVGARLGFQTLAKWVTRREFHNNLEREIDKAFRFRGARR